MSGNDDQLVADYLGRLAAQARALPDDRRAELLEEITAHIAEARARSGGDPDGVRTILGQLGDPADIVSAAGPVLSAPGPRSRPARARAGAYEIITVLFLLIGGIVIPLAGWLVGVVMLWASDRWSTRDKVLGTVIWPGGLLAVLVPVLALIVPVSAQACFRPPGTGCATSTGLPQWLALAIFFIVLLASIAGPIVMAIRLLRQARRSREQEQDSAQDAVYVAA